jgi:hypothetical protein
VGNGPSRVMTILRVSSGIAARCGRSARRTLVHGDQSYASDSESGRFIARLLSTEWENAAFTVGLTPPRSAPRLKFSRNAHTNPELSYVARWRHLIGGTLFGKRNDRKTPLFRFVLFQKMTGYFSGAPDRVFTTFALPDAAPGRGTNI